MSTVSEPSNTVELVSDLCRLALRLPFLIASKSKLTIKPTVNATDADIQIKSCDNMRFGVHTSKLHDSSEIFPGDIPTKDEVVNMPETGDTLELLFHYMYRRPRPVLKDLSIKRVLALAEAAEKYVVYNARDVCAEHLEYVTQLPCKSKTH